MAIPTLTFITSVACVSLAIVQKKQPSIVGMNGKLSECQGVILPAFFLLKATVMIKH